MKHLPLITRLTRQLGGNRGMAVVILQDRGHVYPNTEQLTPEGRYREQLGPAGRAIDRASKRSGRPTTDYKYVRGNRAILK